MTVRRLESPEGKYPQEVKLAFLLPSYHVSLFTIFEYHRLGPHLLRHTTTTLSG